MRGAVVTSGESADGPRLTVCLADGGPWPAAELAHALADAGHEVIRLCRTTGESETIIHQGITTHRLRPEVGAGPPSLSEAVRGRLAWAKVVHAAARRIAADHHLDVVVVPLHDGAGYYCLRDQELRTVLWLDGAGLVSVEGSRAPDERAELALILGLELETLRAARHVCTTDDGTARRLFCSRWPRPEALTVVPLGLPDRAGDFSVTRPAHDTVKVLCVVEPGHAAAAELADAAARLTVAHPNVTCWCAGCVPGRLLAGCDIVCFPAGVEAPAGAAVTALMFGKPVVGAAVGALPGLVTDGWNGFLTYPGSPALLAERLGRLAGDDRQRRALGINARRRYEKRFTPGRMAGTAVAAFRAALGPRRLAEAA